MRWGKKGAIFKVTKQYKWMHYYASTPVPAFAKPNGRIYFSTRSCQSENGNFLSYIGYVEAGKDNFFDLSNTVSLTPALNLGNPGSFDEFGTMLAEIIPVEEKLYMYYMGWQRSFTVPYTISIGLAIANQKDLCFEKYSEGPVMGWSAEDPYGIGNISIIKEKTKWKMWYTSYLPWIFRDAKYCPTYCIKYAESFDGINWKRDNIVCLMPSNDKECVATPSVIRMNDQYHMWFSYRKIFDYKDGQGSYRVGYAVSKDGIHWQRDDSKGVDVSKEGWDSNMTAYPYVFSLNKKHYMLYNGNYFGRDGFGYAELTEE